MATSLSDGTEAGLYISRSQTDSQSGARGLEEGNSVMQGNFYTINSISTLAYALQAMEADFKEHKYLQVQITAGKLRTLPQNAMIYKLYHDAARVTEGETPHTIRRECKLVLGVPILRSEDLTFREKWDDNIKNTLTYEQKLQIMDFWPVSSQMNTEQESRYIDAILNRYSLDDYR